MGCFIPERNGPIFDEQDGLPRGVNDSLVLLALLLLVRHKLSEGLLQFEAAIDLDIEDGDHRGVVKDHADNICFLNPPYLPVVNDQQGKVFSNSKLN